MTDLTHKAQEIFSHDIYATATTGVVIESVELDYARCSLMLQQQHRNAMGAVMGGVMFTLADLAFAAAANSFCLQEECDLSWVSLGSNIQYLSQPKSDKLIAETQCIKRGRTTCLFSITIHDELNNIIAHITTSGMKTNSK